jgi:hypothetical protein
MAGFSVVLASSVMQKVRLEIFCLALMGPKKKKKKKKKRSCAQTQTSQSCRMAHPKDTPIDWLTCIHESQRASNQIRNDARRLLVGRCVRFVGFLHFLQ